MKVYQANEDLAKYRPITGGIEIAIKPTSPGPILVGTLGCLATDLTDSKTVLLTNFHVIGSTAGTEIIQPANGVVDVIAKVKRGKMSPTIDAAIAEIDSGWATTGDEINGLFLNMSNHVVGVADPVSGMRVFKVGRTTGLTIGKIVDADVSTPITFLPPIGTRLFNKFMLIQCTQMSSCCCCTCEVGSSAKFSDHGDSGSAVVSEQHMVLGLVVGSTDDETLACRMTEIEAQLNILVNRVNMPNVPAVHPTSALAPPLVASAISGAATVPNVALARAEDDTVWAAMQRRMSESALGREVGEHVRFHLHEVVGLVNHHRPVMVAWQRVQGPSFLAQWMDGVRNPSQPVPKEVDGVTINAALLKLAAVLKSHGSTALRQSIDTYGLRLMDLLDRSATVDELIENLNDPVAV